MEHVKSLDLLIFFFLFFFFYNFQSLLKRITTWFISLDEMLEIMRESLRIITATLILQSVIWEKCITCPFLAKMAGQVNRLFELKMKKEKRKKKTPVFNCIIIILVQKYSMKACSRLCLRFVLQIKWINMAAIISLLCV